MAELLRLVLPQEPVSCAALGEQEVGLSLFWLLTILDARVRALPVQVLWEWLKGASPPGLPSSPVV